MGGCPRAGRHRITREPPAGCAPGEDKNMNDMWALAISYAYVFSVVGVAELCHRRFGSSSYVTRKLVHAAVGTWVLPTLFLFEAWWWAVTPPLTFLAVNAVGLRSRAFRSIEGADPRNYGPLFFPVAFVIVLPLYWGDDLRFAAGAGILCMAWGDPAASAVGRALGRAHFGVMGSRRSLEGCAAMFLVSLVAAAFAAWILADLGAGELAAVAVSAAAAATAVEAISFWGADDLLVPLASSAAAVFAAGLV